MNINDLQTQKSNSTTFGWNIKTHYRMTKEALKNISTLNNVDKNWLARCSELPDFKGKHKLGWINNAHFYYPDSKHKSYGIGADTINNCLAMFKKEIAAANAIAKKYNASTDKEKEKLAEESLEHIGAAMHFLQDAQTPVHTESGNFIKKLFDMFKHKEYERGKINGASNKLDMLVDQYIPQEIKFTNFEELFIETARHSSKFKIACLNPKSWFSSQSSCFNRGIDVTKKLFEALNKEYPEIGKMIDNRTILK